MLLIQSVLAKGGGGGGRGGGSGGSSGGSRGSSGSSGSSGGSSGQKTYTGTAGRSSLSNPLGRGLVYGYPLYPGYNSFYLYYLMSRSTPYYSSQECVDFNEKPLQLTTSFDQSGTKVYNFYGNGTFEADVRMSLSTDALGFYDTARQLNTTLSLDQTGDLLRTLLLRTPNDTSLDAFRFIGISALNGNLYTLETDTVYTGQFSLYLDLSSSPKDVQVTGIEKLQVSNLTSVSVESLNGTNEIVFQSHVQMTLTNANMTFQGPLTSTPNGVKFDGKQIQFGECAYTYSNNTGMIVGIVVGVVVFLLFIALVVWNLRQKKLKPDHNLHDAGDESFRRSRRFLSIYPPGSPQAIEAAIRTASLPPNTKLMDSSITMMPPRQFSDFPFSSPQPQVDIQTMPDRSQIITFETSQDVSIQSNCALRPHRFASLPLDDLSPPPAYDAASGEGCYYEVEILELGKECTFALGFATCPYPPFRLPGWDTHSVAVHSDDGAKFLNDVDYGQPYSRPFGPGDRVGFGYEIIPMNGQWEFQFYLVLNGTRLPNCFERVQYLFDPLHMYPTIGSDGHCKIVVRFF